MAERVAILDAGAQYCKVIDRKLRELNIHSEILSLNTPVEELTDFAAIVVSGGPQSVYGPDAPKYDHRLFSIEKPILGVCYGMQLITHVFGGKVVKKDTREDGQFDVNVDTTSLLFKDMDSVQPVLLTHGDSVDVVPEGFSVIATSVNGIIAGIQDPVRRIYGVQFHPEVDLTKNGKQMFFNFFKNVAKLSMNYTMSSRKQQAIDYIQKVVGEKMKVLVLVSGGVDSSVCAALLKEAIGADRIVALHIDSGFMRKDESRKVFHALQRIGLNLKVVDASKTFASASTLIEGKESEQLQHTIKPEVKRKIIGDTFMRISEDEVKALGLNLEETLLAQGTLRPDLIESASTLVSSNAQVIKTHHNDTDLVRSLRTKGRIVEPLRDYHKDEVRALGEELGLPHDLVWRQPFPGPGLAIRIICAAKTQEEQAATLPNTEKRQQIIQLLKKGFQTPQIHSTLLPCLSVGVQGDGRTYSSLIGLTYAPSTSASSSASSTSSSITSSQIDWSSLFNFAKQIPKTIHGINRVCFVFGEKLTTDYIHCVTPTYLLPEVVHQLQEADDIVNQVLLKYELIRSLSQVPVILFPVEFDNEVEKQEQKEATVIGKKRSICIRTFITNDFMTGVPAVPGKEMPFEALDEMVARILKEVEGISRVCYDLTSKPPGTTEWE